MMENHILNRLGYLNITKAENGNEAIHKWKEAHKSGSPFAIMFTDQMMPGLSGNDTAARIRQIEKRRNLYPVTIFGLSGDASPEDQDLAIRAGMNKLLLKPLKPSIEIPLKDAIHRSLCKADLHLEKPSEPTSNINYILIISPDGEKAREIVDNLYQTRRESFSVIHSESPEEGLDVITKKAPCCVLIDSLFSKSSEELFSSITSKSPFSVILKSSEEPETYVERGVYWDRESCMKELCGLLRHVSEKNMALSSLNDFIDGVPIIINKIDIERRVTFANNPLSGFTTESILGKNIYDLVSCEDYDEIQKALALAFRGEQAKFNFSFFDAKKVSMVSFFCIASPIFNERGEVYEVLLSSIKTDEEFFKESQEKVSIMKMFFAHINEKVRSLTHDIIGLNSFLLKDESFSEDQRNLLGIQRRVCDQLEGTLDHVSDFTLGTSLAEENFIFDEIRERVSAVIMARIREKENPLAFSFDCAFDPTALFLNADITKINQVLINLASNAVRVTKRGGVEIKARIFHETEGKATIAFRVIDSGPGISLEDQKRLFVEFSQIGVESSTPTTGLGLTISQNIVHLMGGEIRIYSTVGSGSTFHFAITLKKAVPPSPLCDAVSGPLSSRVLVIKNSRSSLPIIESSIVPLGYHVESAFNEEEAIRCLESGFFKLVIIEASNSIGDAVASYIRTREEPGGPRTTICEMDSDTREEVVKRVLESGRDVFLRKPMSPQKIQRTIRNIVSE